MTLIGFPTTLEVRKRACEACGALAGEQCIRRDGGLKHNHHSRRVNVTATEMGITLPMKYHDPDKLIRKLRKQGKLFIGEGADEMNKGQTGATTMAISDPSAIAAFRSKRRKEQERAKRLSGPVTTRQATPEELEAVFGKSGTAKGRKRT